MSEIKITNLEPAGSEFFEDNEGYLNDLSEDDLTVWGGTGGGGITAASISASVASQLSLNTAASLSASAASAG